MFRRFLIARGSRTLSLSLGYLPRMRISKVCKSPTIELVPLPLAQLPAQDHLHVRVTGKVRPAAVHRIEAPRPLVLWHLASLDAPTVAVVWSLAFAWSARVHLPLWAPLLLALMAWSVYIGDRLLDARVGLSNPALHRLRERHYFHWRHRRVFVSLAIFAILAAARIVLVNMPRGALTPNSLLGAATFAYFSGVHSRRKLPRLVTKESLVGIIFTAGCMLPAWLMLGSGGADSSRLAVFLIPSVYFAALAWLNCHAIAQWESHRIIRLRRRSVMELGVGLATAGLLLAVVLAAHDPRAAVLVAAGAASALLLALLDRARRRLTPLALRTAADFVLLTPLVFIPLAHVLG